MSEREKLIQSNSKIVSRITDLRDQLAETNNSKIRRNIQNRINILKDILFYNQETISIIDA